jgi:hypothetical protein
MQRLAGFGKGKVSCHGMEHLQSTISHKYSPFYNADQIQSQNGFAGQRQSERGVLATPGQANNSPAFVV